MNSPEKIAFHIKDLDTLELFILHKDLVSGRKMVPKNDFYMIRFNFKDGSNKEACIGEMDQRTAFEKFDAISKVIKGAQEGKIPASFSLN